MGIQFFGLHFKTSNPLESNLFRRKLIIIYPNTLQWQA